MFVQSSFVYMVIVDFSGEVRPRPITRPWAHGGQESLGFERHDAKFEFLAPCGYGCPGPLMTVQYQQRNEIRVQYCV